MSLGAFKASSGGNGRTVSWPPGRRAFLCRFVVRAALGRISRARLGLKLVGISRSAAAGLHRLVYGEHGLAERIEVSQYRLALHLGLAILILGALLWAALSLDRPMLPAGAILRAERAAAGIIVLVFVQILLGALVAGMKAGQGYNTWPLMDGQLIPAASDDAALVPPCLRMP